MVCFGWNICNCIAETTRIVILELLFYIRYTYNIMPEAAPIRYNSELEQLLKEIRSFNLLPQLLFLQKPTVMI